MECFLQYWDNLDDLIGAVRLKTEQIRRTLVFIFGVLLFGAGVAGGVLLALSDPPLALAVVTLLIIWLLNLSLFRPMPGTAAA